MEGPPDGRYEGQVVLAFPLSFSNACYAALASVAADVSGPGDEATSVRKTTTDKFQLWGEVSSANATITASCVFWDADSLTDCNLFDFSCANGDPMAPNYCISIPT